MGGYQRQQVNIILDRLEERPERIIVVSGPRQTGKTTLIRQALGQTSLESVYLSVDDTEPEEPEIPHEHADRRIRQSDIRDNKWLILEWEKARRSAGRSERGFVLVLDEIQKIPQWSETVKGLWDADRATGVNMHVVILGSAPLRMQQGLTESLAGRFELIRVRHWSFMEMVDAFNFDLDRYVYFGGYPGGARLIHDEPRWRDYVRASLVEPVFDQDILALTRIEKPALMKNLFELGCAYSGQILSYNKMLGSLHDAGNTTTLAHYLILLTNAGLITGLEKHAAQPVRRRASSPKLNVLNTALASVHSGYSFREALADRTFWGRMIESAVGAHLYNTGMPDIKLHYWRKSPHEVDFVLVKGRRLIGIEVKSSLIHGSHGGLSAFEKEFSPEKTLLVGGSGIPLAEFLVQPANHWFETG
ncbi:MAG: ATP-binding protein [Gammaproteobacteria bacterium]|nr:ATP-binding protein [Gammaproteobacteria bacterium]